MTASACAARSSAAFAACDADAAALSLRLVSASTSACSPADDAISKSEKARHA